MYVRTFAGHIGEIASHHSNKIYIQININENMQLHKQHGFTILLLATNTTHPQKGEEQQQQKEKRKKDRNLENKLCTAERKHMRSPVELVTWCLCDGNHCFYLHVLSKALLGTQLVLPLFFKSETQLEVWGGFLAQAMAGLSAFPVPPVPDPLVPARIRVT
jgi:hypothetical protein